MGRRRTEEEEEDLILTIRQCAIMRIYVLIAIFVSVTIFIPVNERYTLYFIGSFGIISTIVELWSAKTKKLTHYVHYPALTVDIALITLSAHYSSNELFFFSLYALSILSSSVSGLKAGLYQAFLVALFYPILLASEHGVISSGSFNSAFFDHLYRVGPGIFLGFVLALMTGIVADRLKRVSKKAEKLTQKIRRLYKESQVSSEVIFEHMEDGFLVIEQDGIIDKANEAASRLLGTDHLVGHNIGPLANSLNPLFAELFTKAKNISLKSGPLIREISISKPERKILEATATPLQLSKNEISIVIVLRDISSNWGEVFDSKDKHQIQGTIVRIFDQEFNKLLATKVTDNEGRFEFLVRPGQYYLRAIKDGYLFPSKELGYKGEMITVTKNTKSLVNVKIPMDRSN